MLAANSYDLVPYPRRSHPYCHPDRLATCAHLLGLTPPPVEQCRVLELGCASGDNLLPIAVAFPESRCVGVDLSGGQVAAGQAEIDYLGLKNITLQALDLQAITPAFGQFDYILAHGLYAWVPVSVRNRLMAICQENLAPAGVAFVSYNTYPGWHSLAGIRRMMLYHVRETTQPAERAAKARALLEFLAEAADPADYYGAMLAAHRQSLHAQGADDAYLLHEYLEDINEPLYFHEFASHAAQYDLRYLCDAEFRLDFLTNFPKAVASALVTMSHNFAELEQHMDFVRNRQFRQTLLVHAGQPVSYRLSAERLHQLWVGSPAQATAAEIDLKPDAVEVFTGRDHSQLSTAHPLTKAAMAYLRQLWPGAVPFDTLVTEAQAWLAGPGSAATPEAIDQLASNLLQAFTGSESLVEFQASVPRFTLDVGPRPLASPWARRQAETGLTVTNLRHERIVLEAPEAQLLRRLDGTHDRAALLRAGEPGALDIQLDGLAHAGLLMSP